MQAPEWIEALPDGVDPDGVLEWVRQAVEPLAQFVGVPWQAVAIVLLVGVVCLVASVVERAAKVLVVGAALVVLVLIVGRFLA